jgi:hypothetical protein
MKTIELTILAEDIENTHYVDAENCAITRAFKRAGIDAMDQGLRIKHKSGEEISINHELNTRVLGMYKYLHKVFAPRREAVKPQDFTFTIEVPDNW